MIKGPFKIKISKKAEKVDVEHLNEKEKERLLDGVSFDPSKYDIFKFYLLPVFDFHEKLSRKQKKISYEKVDRVLVLIEVGNEELAFKGIFPTTCNIHGQFNFDLAIEGEIGGNIGIVSGKLKTTGSSKNIIRKNILQVFASRTDMVAEWIFLKPWMENGNDFKLQIVIFVPKELNNSHKFIDCSAQFQSYNRILYKLIHKKVLLTATS